MQEIVARVDGSPIGRFEFENCIQEYALEQCGKKADALSAQERKDAEQFALVKLIARELMYLAALRQGVVANEADVSTLIDKTIADYRSLEDFERALGLGGIDLGVYRRIIRKDMTVNLMNDAKLAEISDPADAEIAAVYDAYPEKMVNPAQVRARHILITISEGDIPGAMKMIEGVRKQCGEKPFPILAQEFSHCPSASEGGGLGWFTRRDMPEPFAEAAFALQPGEISDPVQTTLGLHLIELLERKEEERLSLEQATPRIRKFLIQEKSAQLLETWVEELKEQATIEVLIDIGE